MTSAIRTKAYSLPELLLTLPRDGIGALVRPSSSPNSVYRVTRSKLKFRARSENGESSAASSTAGKDELLAVSGKIWGMRFDNGRYVAHTKSATPSNIDGLIRERLAARWTQVKEDELDSKAKESIKAKLEELKAST